MTRATQASFFTSAYVVQFHSHSLIRQGNIINQLIEIAANLTACDCKPGAFVGKEAEQVWVVASSALHPPDCKVAMDAYRASGLLDELTRAHAPHLQSIRMFETPMGENCFHKEPLCVRIYPGLDLTSAIDQSSILLGVISRICS